MVRALAPNTHMDALTEFFHLWPVSDGPFPKCNQPVRAHSSAAAVQRSRNALLAVCLCVCVNEDITVYRGFVPHTKTKRVKGNTRTLKCSASSSPRLAHASLRS